MRKIIRTNGTEVEMANPVAMNNVPRMIGADTLDTVVLRHLGSPLHVMMVDDSGWETVPEETEAGGVLTIHLRAIKPNKPINLKATEMYLRECRPGTMHQIAGDVYICPDEDFA